MFKRVMAAYGHQIAVHTAQLPGIFGTRKDKDDRGESTEIKESAFAITQARFADNRNEAELIRN